MEAPSRRDLELNEVRWWSNWARLAWFGEGYLLSSDALREPFFNRAGALTCAGVVRTAAWAESKLVVRGMRSTILVFDSCASGMRVLGASGYKTVDSMGVLVSRGPIGRGVDTGLRIATPTSAGGWARAYLRAFYGSEEFASRVTPIIGRLLKAKAVTPLEARVEGRTAGVLAIFRTRGIAGVYCVGTIPEYRMRGVATGLLAKAKEIAMAERRTLVLQTLASDRAGSFYSDRGFVGLYSKRVMEKER